MNDGDLSLLIEMMEPLFYVVGVYFLISAIRSIFRKQKENKNKPSTKTKQGSKKL